MMINSLSVGDRRASMQATEMPLASEYCCTILDYYRFESTSFYELQFDLC